MIMMMSDDDKHASSSKSTSTHPPTTALPLPGVPRHSRNTQHRYTFIAISPFNWTNDKTSWVPLLYYYLSVWNSARLRSPPGPPANSIVKRTWSRRKALERFEQVSVWCVSVVSEPVFCRCINLFSKLCMPFNWTFYSKFYVFYSTGCSSEHNVKGNIKFLHK